MSEHSVTYLAGDIGGTNSRLQLFQVKSTAGLQSPGACDTPRASDHGEQLLHSHTYPSQVRNQASYLLLSPLAFFSSSNALSFELAAPDELPDCLVWSLIPHSTNLCFFRVCVIVLPLMRSTSPL
jgi:hypothetical protein